MLPLFVVDVETDFNEPYSFGGVTLGVPAPAFERPHPESQETQTTHVSN